MDQAVSPAANAVTNPTEMPDRIIATPL
jgi:hypothetical protein